MAKGGDSGGKHGLVGIISHHFRECHQLPGTGMTENEIVIDELTGVQFVYTCLLLQADKTKARSLQTIGHKKTRLELTGMQM
jgi:hypothetical protein